MRPLSLLYFLAFVVSLTGMTDTGLAQCLDLRKPEPIELSGRLTQNVAPASPNDVEARKAGFPAAGFNLVLDEPICVKGPDPADPVRTFSTVELIATERTARFLPLLRNSQVAVSVASFKLGATRREHTTLTAAATGIAELENAMVGYKTPADYGNAARTVTAFYQSLATGNGDEAEKYIAPSHRSGPLSASAMTRFYSRLSEPLRLTGIHQIGASEFFVSYRFSAPGRSCHGRAIVRTVARGGANYIDHISALDGC